MKGYVEVIQEANCCHIVLLLRVSGGQVCREKHKIMLKSVTSAKSLLQTIINLGAY